MDKISLAFEFMKSFSSPSPVAISTPKREVRLSETACAACRGLLLLSTSVPVGLKLDDEFVMYDCSIIGVGQILTTCITRRQSRRFFHRSHW